MTDLATRIADVKKKAEAAKNIPVEVQMRAESIATPEGVVASRAVKTYCETASPDLILAMAAEIEALTAKLEKARETLEPFAKAFANRYPDPLDECLEPVWNGHLRIAARISEELREKP